MLRADAKDSNSSSKFSGSCVITLQTLPVSLVFCVVYWDGGWVDFVSFFFYIFIYLSSPHPLPMLSPVPTSDRWTHLVMEG